MLRSIWLQARLATAPQFCGLGIAPPERVTG
jgi:hypothetical protein